jgi:hypothetical protein
VDSVSDKITARFEGVVVFKGINNGKYREVIVLLKTNDIPTRIMSKIPAPDLKKLSVIKRRRRDQSAKRRLA